MNERYIDKALRAAKSAADEVWAEAARNGRSLPVCRNGEVVWVDAAERLKCNASSVQEEPPPYKPSSDLT